MIILNATNFIKFGAVGAEEDDFSFPMYLAYSIVPELKLPLQTSARSGQVFLKGSPSPLQHFIFCAFRMLTALSQSCVLLLLFVCLFFFSLISERLGTRRGASFKRPATRLFSSRSSEQYLESQTMFEGQDAASACIPRAV